MHNNNTTTPQPVTRTLHAPATVHLRQAAGPDAPESRTIEGYAILFNTPSAVMYRASDQEVREQIAPEAVTQQLLDSSDIKMTMNHDFSTLLARSKQGQGTLSYNIDTRGVHFSFEAPRTDDGDRALELVRRGDIDGCSFMFTCRYSDPACVTRTVTYDSGSALSQVLYTIRSINSIHDFTLTPMPAYPGTQVSARQLREMTSRATHDSQRVDGQVREMRQAAHITL
ncbi:HK97 family phage prohead protease [Prevotellamassilia timonensis]|uniref:HK97 family phage prohead protease n=1 Tax=Prevotellamassilia timonensis TaxID=1852370 RepID=UPI00307F5A55